MTQLHRLPPEELAAVLGSPHRGVLAVGVERIDEDRLVLYLGDLTTRVVPLAIFEPKESCTPDFDDIRLGDYGHWICLGAYEARTDAILADIRYEAARAVDCPAEFWIHNTHQLLVLAAIAPPVAAAAIRHYLRRAPWDEVQELVEELSGTAVDRMAATEYEVTKHWLQRFEDALAGMQPNQLPVVNASLREACIDAMRSQVEELRQQIAAYEAVHARQDA